MRMRHAEVRQMSKQEAPTLSAAELAELDKLKREVAEAERETDEARDELERELKRELNECTQALYGCSFTKLLERAVAYGFELKCEQEYKRGFREGFARAKGRKPSWKKRSERALLIDAVKLKNPGQTVRDAVQDFLQTLQAGKDALAMHAKHVGEAVLDCLHAEQANDDALKFSRAIEAGKDVFDLLRAMEASKDARVLRAMEKAKQILANIKLPERVAPNRIPDADVDKEMRAYYRHHRNTDG